MAARLFKSFLSIGTRKFTTVGLSHPPHVFLSPLVVNLPTTGRQFTTNCRRPTSLLLPVSDAAKNPTRISKCLISSPTKTMNMPEGSVQTPAVDTEPAGTVKEPMGRGRERPNPSLLENKYNEDCESEWKQSHGGPKITPRREAVVKVFCVHTEPNFSLPWQKERQYSSTSTGFVISGRRVLTNAHSVEYHTQVKLKKCGSDTKYMATVLAIATECDLAMLTVDDDEFWDGVVALEFGSLPALQDPITVVGYPIGGETISMTSGVVSRVETQPYGFSSTELLALQIDAAINSGNSGGPAFSNNGKCVGVAFQSLKQEDVENVGYLIPTPVISHFLQDCEKSGEYTGFPVFKVKWQEMENADLRAMMGMSPGQKGVRIKSVEPTSPESEYLKPSDVILSLDGVDIANDGTVPFRQGERIEFSHLISRKYTGESSVIRVLRESKVHEFEIKLTSRRKHVPSGVHNKGFITSYYVIAGFVFIPLSVSYLRSEFGSSYRRYAPLNLLRRLRQTPQSEDEEAVMVAQVLVADVNIGYEDIENVQVFSFNGSPVKNLKSFAAMVESCQDEYLKFDLDDEQLVVLNTKKARAATSDILSTHGIPSAMSVDLRP